MSHKKIVAVQPLAIFWLFIFATHLAKNIKLKALRSKFVYDVQNDAILELKGDGVVKGAKDILTTSNYNLLLDDNLEGYINYSNSKYDTYRETYFGSNPKLYSTPEALNKAFKYEHVIIYIVINVC